MIKSNAGFAGAGTGILTLLAGKKSIRLQMIWSFVISILAGVISNLVIPVGLVFQVPVSLIVFVAVFFLTFFALTRRTVLYLLSLADGLALIAKGNLHYRIPAIRQDELGNVAVNINAMAEKLERQIEIERQSEKSKMELITGVSHDLRTPLTSMIGYLDLLKERACRDEAEYDRFVGNAYNKAVQLKRLVDDLFEYTRLTSHDANLQLQSADLRAMLHQMTVEYEPIAAENGIGLEVAFPPQPQYIRLDIEKIRRAVDNLLTNALKFSLKPGVIRILLETDRQKIAVVVENEGVPISKEQAEKLFDRFYKADDSRTGDSFPTGSGLGLSIARSIAELHGGLIRFAHDAGRFRFSMELPVHDT